MLRLGNAYLGRGPATIGDKATVEDIPTRDALV